MPDNNFCFLFLFTYHLSKPNFISQNSPPKNKTNNPTHTMSHLSCFNYKGFGEAKRKELWYSQAIRVGDKIECAGQGVYTTI